MKKYQNIDNKKLMLKLEKPMLLHILSNNKFNYKINSINNQNKHIRNTSISPLVLGRNNKLTNNPHNFNKLVNQKKNLSPKKTFNYLKNNANNINRTTPMKYQYKKIPFEKVKGFKLKLPNSIYSNKPGNYNSNNKKNLMNNQQNCYPIIVDRNLSTIDSNINTKKEKQNKSSYTNINYNNAYKNNNTINNLVNDIKAAKIETNLNNNTIQDQNINNNNNKSKSTEKKIIIYHDNKKPLQQQIETKSSSLGSKLETREESGNYLRSKSFINSQLFNNNIKFVKSKNNGKHKNFSFVKFDKINNKYNKFNFATKKKILKYLDKTIKELTTLKTIILDDKDSLDYKDDKEEIDINEETEEDEKLKEDLKNKFIKIDLEKIGKNLDKFKNKIDIDKNTINISYEGNQNDAHYYNYNGLNRKGNKEILKKLNKTITYDNLKANVKENRKFLNLNQKSFKNFKKLNLGKRTKSEKFRKYETVSTYGDFYNYNYKGLYKKIDNNKIKNYDTEITIPKLKFNFNKNGIDNNTAYDNEINKIKEEKNYLNNETKIKDRYNGDNEADNNADIANFEFSD